MSYLLDAAKLIALYEGFAPTAMWDVNHYRLGFGSDTITLDRSGNFREVQAGDTTTKELATIDLARRIPNDFEPILKKQLGNGYNKLNDCTKVALLSFVYNYGSILPHHKGILKYGQEGNNVETAKAIVTDTLNDNKRLSVHDQNALKSRRIKERDYALNCGSGSIVSIPPNVPTTEKKNNLIWWILGGVGLILAFKVLNDNKNG